MKKLFFVVMCVGFFSLQAHQEEQADVLYSHGQWSAALAAYEKESNPSTGVLMRMGECAARSKLYPQALGYLYKALPRLYMLSYYNFSLYIVGIMSEAGLVGAGEGLTPQWYVATAFAAVPPIIWQLLSLLFLLYGLMRMRSWWQYRMYGVMILVACSVLVCVGAAWWSIGYRQYIGGVASEALTLRSGPDMRFSVIGSLPAGIPLHIAGYLQMPNGPWYCKVSGNTLTGWVAKESVIIL